MDHPVCQAQCVVVLSFETSVDHLQAALSKLLTYGVLRSTQPATVRGTGNEL